MTPFERHLSAATGWLELGLPLEAHDELEQIEPGMRALTPVLAVHVFIYQTLEKWEPMKVVATELCRRQPDDPQWFILLGYATRRAVGLQEALAVLATVANRFPACATILYNLACYAAQLGHLHTAWARLGEAIKLDPAYREMALTDGDLAPLHEEIRDWDTKNEK